MHRVGVFEKVTTLQFFEDLIACDIAFEGDPGAALEVLSLPERATSGSAGYDFRAPFPFTLAPGASITMPTGLRVRIDEGWWLAILPRSGHGFKYRVQLDNTVGVIDSDYYGADNLGHILIRLTNDSRAGKTFSIRLGDSFAQGIFLPYGITYADSGREKRTGGFGSTGG